VWRALPPIALGHLIAVGVVVLTAALAQTAIAPGAMRLFIAVTLMTLGTYRLWRHRHPRFGGMQVGPRDLTVWSCLMASAHGAGLMVLPFVMPTSGALSAAGHEHMHDIAATSATSVVGIAVAIHTLAYLSVMALVAWVVYRKLGLRVLRKAWFNMDWLWACALLVTGVVVLLR
jgi:hypothetical protein